MKSLLPSARSEAQAKGQILTHGLRVIGGPPEKQWQTIELGIGKSLIT